MRIVNILILILFSVTVIAQEDADFIKLQNDQLTGLRRSLISATNDSLKIDACRELGFFYQESKYDSSFYFHNQQLSLAKKLKMKLWEADALSQLGYMKIFLGDYPGALKLFYECQEIAEDPRSSAGAWNISRFSGAPDAEHARLSIIAINHFQMALLYANVGDSINSVANNDKAYEIGLAINNYKILCLANMNRAWQHYDVPDSIIFYFRVALKLAARGYEKYNGQALYGIGNGYLMKDEYDSARLYFLDAVNESKRQLNTATLSDGYSHLARFYKGRGKPDSSMWYARKAMRLYESSSISSPAALVNINSLMSSIYKDGGNLDSAFLYQEKAMDAMVDLDNTEKVKQFQRVGFNEQLRLIELEKEKIAFGNKIRTYSMLAGIIIFFGIAMLLFRNNQHRKKANELLLKQKVEIELQKKNVETTLMELKATQSQLIQSEKMASLGQLTAGIAHEIQNPLNFVNNFSEVNRELLEELKSQKSKIKTGTEEQIEEDLLQSIIENEKKISHHGKRADAIVKGMLEHSRTGSGEKQLTDLNALADEYLRLAYHGFRNKNSSFNATLQTDFDSRIGQVNIIPQDIGRVLLNLFSNAFHALWDRVQAKNEASGEYEPTLIVTTKKSSDKILISVKDNGYGIPANIIDKIFQPFFTTRPTGSGTGLGLSLSYDIIRAAGGEIKVNSVAGEYAEFIVSFPA